MQKTWRDIGTLYHIYPRSFQDSNGDGVGDITGITQRLDYLSETLGVDAIWLSPFSPSPMKDFGYDVADYRGVDPDYGTLDDFKELLNQAHKRNIKVMIDLVPCHTSDQHAWFQESRNSTSNPKRDYYTWRDPGPDGGPPNNWLSVSGGKSWTFDEKTGQYYLHSFLSSQPDLNWDNPAVREEIKNIIRWWFDLGVDGMRVDAIWGISKDPELRDDPVNHEYPGDLSQYGNFIHDKCRFGPHFTEYLKELADTCEEYDDRQMIFEFYPDDKLGNYADQYQKVAHANPRAASTFFMELIRSPWHAENIGRQLDEYINHAVKPAIPIFCLGNHDQPRIASRIGDDRARAMSLLSLTLPGISVLYYGDEIGMTNGVLTPEQVRDRFSPLNEHDNTRDLERTPMQWDDSIFAGFSNTEPWLPVHENRTDRNTVTERNNPDSTLNLHRELIKLRKEYPALIGGTFERFYAGSGYVLAFKRELGSQRLYVLVNFAEDRQPISLPEHCAPLLSSRDKNNVDVDSIEGNSAAIFVADSSEVHPATAKTSGNSPTIFIKIASYRDSELPKTIASCLATASDPSALRFGIVHQYDDATKEMLDQYRDDSRFKIIDQHWRKARGVGQARRATDELYDGEDYYLQIDSHMRFEDSWDKRLLEQLAACKDPMAILSSYPPAYIYKDGKEELRSAMPNRLVVNGIFNGTIPIFYGTGIPNSPTHPVRALFVSGGLQFGPGKACLDVPYEPEISFIGEEIVHSMRLFAAGYRIYTPIDQPIHHLYNRSENQEDVHHLWKDFTADRELAPIYHESTKHSYAKVNRYLTGDLIDDDMRKRFEDFCGVDLFTYKVHPTTYEVGPMPLELPDDWRNHTIAPIKK